MSCMCCHRVGHVLVLLLLLVAWTDSFVQECTRGRGALALAAKKGKSSKGGKKRKATGGSGSGMGFGSGGELGSAEVSVLTRAPAAAAIPAAGTLPDDNFPTFPPLPKHVKDTLEGLVAAGEGKEAGRELMSAEVADRVKQVYGFGSFQAEVGHPLFPGLRVLHRDPTVIAVDDFFTAEECDEYIAMSNNWREGRAIPTGAEGAAAGRTPASHKQQSGVLDSKDKAASAQRTSTTWFHHFRSAPELMAKSSALLGVSFDDERWEEPQTVRYRAGEKFTWHMDAIPAGEDGTVPQGGQRVATLLVYLTDLGEGSGGATAFRDLGPLRVRPRKGSALLFFPAAGAIPSCPFDIRTLHAGEVVEKQGDETKWIAQLWLRQGKYTPHCPAGNGYTEAAKKAVASFESTWRAQEDGA